MKIIKSWENKKEIEKIINRYSLDDKTEKIAGDIIAAVRRKGDWALLSYTRALDGVDLKASELRVSPEEIEAAYRKTDKQLLKTINSIRKNITVFHKQELRESWLMSSKDSTSGQIYQPLDRVGIYVPGGTAPLLSSLLMTAVLAQVAGVKNLVMVSPPGTNGDIHPYLLAGAHLLNINEIYRIGGAQAIAALALGTETIPRVDKIAGPGNKYVVAAMRQVFGEVGIGTLPGPSEVVVLADSSAKLPFVLADLKAQAEHETGLAVLVTTSLKLAGEVGKAAKNCYVIITKSIKEAVQLINKIAPEHLEIMVKCPEKVLPEIRNCGTVFLGAYAPTAVGDYVTGPSHVLPTGGTARFSSGLSVDDFRRRTNVISYNKEGLKKTLKSVTELADMEGMQAHKKSVEVRLGEKKNEKK